MHSIVFINTMRFSKTSVSILTVSPSHANILWCIMNHWSVFLVHQLVCVHWLLNQGISWQSRNLGSTQANTMLLVKCLELTNVFLSLQQLVLTLRPEGCCLYQVSYHNHKAGLWFSNFFFHHSGFLPLLQLLRVFQLLLLPSLRVMTMATPCHTMEIGRIRT